MQEQMGEQEINLREFINVLIKRKWIVIAVFFVAIIVAAIISAQMPKIYEISMILEPGIIEVTDNREAIYLNSTENTEAKTEKIIFKDKITKILHLDPREGIADFKILRIINPDFQKIWIDRQKITNPKILKISIERQEEQIPSGIKILNQLFEQLRLTSQEIVDSEHDKIEKQISDIFNDIATESNEINLEQEAQKEKLALLKEKEKQLSLLIQLHQSYITKTFNKISALSEESEAVDDGRFQSYVKIIRQNMLYTNELQAELDNLNGEKSSMIAEIEDSQNAVKFLTIKIEELNRKKDNISNVKLVQGPEVSSSPITSKKRQNVTLAGILGLMLGTLLAFFMEKRK